MSLSNHLVILTCTLETQMTTQMKRSNFQTRLEDYVNSISKWANLAEKEGFRILVIENSNRLEILKRYLPALENFNIIFKQAPLDEASHLKGNSAGEFLMLRSLVAGNELPQNIDVVWKITGRLYVSNFARIAKSCGENFTVNRLYSDKHIIDTRCIGFSKNTFEMIFGSNFEFEISPRSIESFTDYAWTRFSSLEGLVTRIVLELENSGLSAKSMSRIPIFQGISATSNKVIDNRLSVTKKRIANSIRPLVIKLLAGSVP
jgi:hypothetical protein